MPYLGGVFEMLNVERIRPHGNANRSRKTASRDAAVRRLGPKQKRHGLSKESLYGFRLRRRKTKRAARDNLAGNVSAESVTMLESNRRDGGGSFDKSLELRDQTMRERRGFRQGNFLTKA